MFELRWKKAHSPEDFGLDGSRWVLQQRFKYDATIYAGLGPFPESHKQMVWSEWADVPFVE